MTEESIFAEALALTNAAARAEYLDRVCADNADLRAAVEALLAAHAGGSPLDRSPTGLGRTGPYTPSSAAVGDRVGPYKLLEMIGEGGMGEVWVADQAEPIKRRVALKLIKPGMDSRGVLGRFEAERQALAVMDHPNIAKVLDAGQSADGRPYFVMELVKGVPITEYCDARKLTPTERLELFVPVCQAIQHAHMKGIIHRDIKPSNVLVALHDEVAVPKVIDFGVAKAVGLQLTDKTIYTGFGTLIGTPAYMAPEQATFNQLDIDTRADVYALGVLLYELLAGSPPLEKERLKQAALDEVLRLVREEEPPRPSQKLSTSQTRASIAALRGTEPEKLSSLMRGELDWIVMKALEKDRTRRYETANGFAADVMRYLNGEPVQAVPPSLGYRLRKAYRKNKAAVWASATFATLLLLGIVGTSLGWLAARENERRAHDAEQAAREEQAKTQQANQQLERIADLQRRTRYAAEMNLLQAAYTAGNLPEVARLLNAQRPKPGEPDLRGFEWNYWNRKLNGHIREVRIPRKGLADDGKAVALSPNGSLLATARETEDGRVILSLWSTVDGRTTKEVELPAPTPNTDGTPRTAPVYHLDFSLDSTRVTVLRESGRNRARLWSTWDLNTGMVEPLKTSLRITEITLEALRINGYPPEASRFHHAAQVGHLRHDNERLLVYYRQGRIPRLINGNSKITMECWKRGETKPLWQRDVTQLGGFPPAYIVFLGKGEQFAEITQRDQQVIISICETDTGKVVESLPPLAQREMVDAFDWSRGYSHSGLFIGRFRIQANRAGRRLVFQLKNRTVVIDLELTRQRLKEWRGRRDDHNMIVVEAIESLDDLVTNTSGIGIRDDGSALVTMGRDSSDYIVRTWSLNSDSAFGQQTMFPYSSLVRADGLFVAVPLLGETNRLRVLANTGEAILDAPIPYSRTHLNLSEFFLLDTQNGRYLCGGAMARLANAKYLRDHAPGGSPVLVWDLHTRKEVACLKPDPGLGILSCDIDEAGGQLALALYRLEDVSKTERSNPRRPRSGITSNYSVPVQVKVYSFPELRWQHDLPVGEEPLVDPVLYHHRGEWVLHSLGNTKKTMSEPKLGLRQIRRWDSRTRRYLGVDEVEVQVHPQVEPSRDNRANTTRGLSPDGTRLMETSRDEAILYDMVSARQLLSLRYTTPRLDVGPVRGLWSADGTQFWYAVDSKGKLVGFDARPLPEAKP